MREGTLRVAGPGAPVIVQAWLRHGGETPAGSAESRADIRLAWQVLRRRMPTAVAWIGWPEGAEEVHLDIACTFDRPAPTSPSWFGSSRLSPPANGRSSPAAGQRSGSSPQGGAREEQRPLLVPPRLVKPLGQMNQRAASYARSCTALQVSAVERCIVADHRILPLSWTRDAYWQARLLLSTWSRGGHDEDARIVADHLRWLYLRCERPAGRWLRSHDVLGRPHDLRFAADEQLYPILELVDYATVTGSLPELPPEHAWGPLVTDAWAAAEAAIDADNGLIASDENAAADVPPYPFLVSNQLLLWSTATRLAEIAEPLGLSRVDLLALATRTRAAVDAHFLVDGPHGRQWASAVDGQGASERYLDATDLPVALAPLWGFCKPTAPAWRATMRFGFASGEPGVRRGSGRRARLAAHARDLDAGRHHGLAGLRPHGRAGGFRCGAGAPGGGRLHRWHAARRPTTRMDRAAPCATGSPGPARPRLARSSSTPRAEGPAGRPRPARASGPARVTPGAYAATADSVAPAALTSSANVSTTSGPSTRPSMYDCTRSTPSSRYAA